MKNPNAKLCDYMLPNGYSTTVRSKFEKAWRDLYEPVEQEFGMHCTQFSPGAMFRLNEDGAERTEPMPSIALPTWFLIKLADLCQEVKKHRPS